MNETYLIVISAYLLIMNALGLLLMLIDKKKAQRGSWRIKEATLMTVAALGGSLGSLLGMRLFRHKTKHPKFYIGIPLFLVIHVLLGAYLLWRFVL